MSTPAEVKALIAQQIPDNDVGAIQPSNLRSAMDASVDYATQVGIPAPVNRPSQFMTNGVDGDAPGWESYTLARYNMNRGKVTHLMDDEAFRTAWNAGEDVAPAVQAIIDATPNTFTTAMILCYPADTTVQSDVNTGSRQVNFRGVGQGISFITPAADIDVAVFLLGGPLCSVTGFTINDIANSRNVPGFTPDPSNTKALINVGRGAATVARRCFIYDCSLNDSRGLGVYWEGGSFLVMDRVSFVNCYSGGFMSGTGGGDTNHFKFRDCSFTRCFNFGMWLRANNNGGGAGSAEVMKFFECQNVGLKLDGSANNMSVFVEGTNGSGEGVRLTRTGIGEYTLTAQDLPAMVTLAVGRFIDGNPPTGFAEGGLYITDLDYATLTVTVSQPAISTGTTLYRTFSTKGQRSPSVLIGPNAISNVLHIIGDALDPSCVFDDSGTASNTIIVNNTHIKFNTDTVRFTPFGAMPFDPNLNTRFQVVSTTEEGSNIVTMQQTGYANRITYGASIQSIGFPNSTVVAVDPVANTIQISNPATKTGTFLVEVIPSAAAGIFERFISPNVLAKQSYGQYRNMKEVTLIRGALFMGCTTQDSNQLTYVGRWDNEIDGPSVGNKLWTDNGAIPQGTTITAVSGNATDGWTLTMSQNATLTRSGVLFHLHGDNTIQYIWPYIQQYSSNAAALAAGANYGLLYRTTTGEVRSVVSEAAQQTSSNQLSVPTINNGTTWNSGDLSLPGLGLYCTMEVACSRALQGMQMWAQPTAADTYRIYIKNDTGGNVGMGTTSFKVAAKTL